MQWASNAWRNQNLLLRIIIKKNSEGKYPSVYVRVKWGDMIRRDVESLNGGSD